MTLSDHMALNGYTLDFNPNTYFGKIKRMKLPYVKSRNLDGWLIYKGDHAIYGDWKTGNRYVWNDKKFVQDYDAVKRCQKLYSVIAREEKKNRKEAANIAKILLKSYKKATKCNPYLKRKGIYNIGDICIDEDRRLAIPISIEGKITSIQYITGKGEKRFMKNGEIKGGYFKIEGSESERVVLCEGYATAVSIYLNTGATVYCAFTCHNLREVALYIYRERPNCNLIVAGDSDEIGKKKAIECAQKVGTLFSSVMIPNFKKGEKGTDFNDLGAFNIGDTEWSEAKKVNITKVII